MSNRDQMKNYCDHAAVFCFGLMVLTGVLLTRIDPTWDVRSAGMPIDIRGRILGLSNVTWVTLHRLTSFLTLVALVPNLFLEWRALRRGSAEGSRPRAFTGLIATLGLLLLLAGVFRTPGQSAYEAPVGLEAPREMKTLEQLTLADIEGNMRVPRAYLTKRLGIPADAPADSPLSILAPRYGLTLNDVQMAILDYRSAPAREPKR